MNESTISGFELIEKLGEGGMGSVIKARQISLDRIVALKLLPPRLVSTQEDIEQFKLEARAAAKLKHEGLAQIYEAGDSNGIYYFAMEFIDGQDIHKQIATNGCIPEKDALSIAYHIASALDYAWSTEGIIHRDIKPSNVLIDKNGKVKLIDLGLVKVSGKSSGATVKGDILGTPNYCSPEQAEGQKQDCRSDIYGLGATLYHMVTGQMPFEDFDGAGAMIQHVTGQLPDPRSINPALSSRIVRLISLMMAKKPSDRYIDWKEAIKDIKRVEKGKSPIKQPSTSFHSTINVSSSITHQKRTASKARRSPYKRSPVSTHDKSPLPIIVTLVIAAVLCIVMLVYFSAENKRKAETDRLNFWAANLLDEVESHHASKPEDYDASHIAYLRLASNGALPQHYRSIANERAINMKEMKKQAIQAAITDITKKVERLLSEKDFENALRLCNSNSDSDPFTDFTANARETLRATINKQQKDQIAKEKAEEDEREQERLAQEKERIEREKIETARLAAEEEIRQNTPAELTTLKEGYNRALEKCQSTSEETILKDQYIIRLNQLIRKLVYEKQTKQALVVKEYKDSYEQVRKSDDILNARLNSSLVLHFGFDKYVEGIIEDTSPARLHGTASKATWISDGYKGGAYSFNGMDSQMVGPDWSALKIDQELTIDFWVRFPDRNVLKTYSPFVSAPPGFLVAYKRGNILIEFGGKQFTMRDVEFTHEKWIHLIIVADSTKADLYIDGKLVRDEHPKNVNRWPPEGKLDIGSQSDPNANENRTVKAELDELKIYNSAFDSDMIQEIIKRNQK